MLHGERVTLRAIECADLPHYVPWPNDPAVLEYFGTCRPMTLAQAEKGYEFMLQDRNVLNFAIEVDGRHVGGCGFANMDHPGR